MDRQLRRADWRLQLRDYLRAVRQAPFDWAGHNCALFVAGAVARMTGQDFAAPYRRRRSAATALRALRADGFADHVAYAAHCLPEVAPSDARPGDVAVVPVPDGLALGIVQGDWVYLVGPQGLQEVPRMQMVRAFRV